MPLLEVIGLTKRYGEQPVFQGVNLALAPGEFVALLGESGVGKSTLLNCIAGLDDADAGRITLQPPGEAAVELAALDDTARALLRRRALGFVFQAFHVLPHLTVAQNVSLPRRLAGLPFDEEVGLALQEVGLQGLAERAPAELSGGQLQRVAIARALVHRPALVLADEPTGNLDPDTAARVLEVLQRRCRDQGSACLLVTHSEAAAARADRRLRLTPQGMVG